MRSGRHHRRHGMTLIEIMVVIAIIAIVLGVAVPGVMAILDVQQRDAAKSIAQTYTWLLEEAAMRNATFRVAYDLDHGTWQVQVGDPNTLVFDTPDKREDFEQSVKDEMKRFTSKEIEEGKADDLKKSEGSFQGLNDPVFTSAQPLPDSCHFAYVYTPEYGPNGMTPSDTPPDDPNDDHMAYTYVFPDGSSEHAVIRIVRNDDETDGYTIEIEPISGKVTMTTDVIDPSQSMSQIPTDGPLLQ